MLKKIKNKKAFTLSETLVAVLIMLMVSSILVTGIPAAKSAYEKVFVKSNAEVAMSTAIYALRGELSGARDIDVKSSNKVFFMNSTYGSISKIYLADGKIMFQRYALVNDEDSTTGVEPLISDSAADGLFVRYDSITEGDRYITFNGLGVYKKATGNDPLLKRNLSITTF